MKKALLLASQAAKQGEVPVAAILTDSVGDIIASSQNRMHRNQDPTAHAEMLVLAQCKSINSHHKHYFLHDCYLFVTLEPCPMCAHAIALMRIKALYFAAYDVKGGGVDHGARIFAQSGCNHIPEIIGGLYQSDSEKLLSHFFQKRRQNP